MIAVNLRIFFSKSMNLMTCASVESLDSFPSKLLITDVNYKHIRYVNMMKLPIIGDTNCIMFSYLLSFCIFMVEKFKAVYHHGIAL